MATGVANRLQSRTAALILLESLMIVGAVAGATALRLGLEELATFANGPGLARALVIAVVCQICLYFNDLYDLRVVADRRELFVRVLQALSATSIILGFLYYWFPSLIIGRGVFLGAVLLVIA